MRASGVCGPPRSRRSSSTRCSLRRTRRWASRYSRERDWEKRHGVIRSRHRAEPESHADSHGLLRHAGALGQPERGAAASRSGADHGSAVARRAEGAGVRAVPRRPLRRGHRERAGGHLPSIPTSMSDLLLARALTFAGRPEEAIAVWRAVTPSPSGGWERWLAHAYVMTGRTKELERLAASQQERASVSSGPLLRRPRRQGPHVRGARTGRQTSMPHRTAVSGVAGDGTSCVATQGRRAAEEAELP